MFRKRNKLHPLFMLPYKSIQHSSLSEGGHDFSKSEGGHALKKAKSRGKVRYADIVDGHDRA
jgi:hypothetical protein